MHSRKMTLVAMVAVLPVLAGTLACSDDDPITPAAPEPSPTGAISVDVSPDSCTAAWSLAGTGSNTFDGTGDSLLTGVVPGDYEIVWCDLDGYGPPDPPRETRSVTAGDTITFRITYVAAPPEPVKVLFLGSSYFFSNALVDLFAGLAEAKGREVEIDGHFPPGNYLDYHVTNATTDALIRSRVWDYVILQGVGRITAYPDDAHFNLRTVLGDLERKIHRLSGEAKVMFQMPWAFEDGMLWTPDGTDDYFAMQQKIYDQTLEHASDLDLVIAPVGWAWNSVMGENPPKHYLFLQDWNHPSLRGSYLMACVFYAAVFLESAEGGTYYGGLPAREASHFQAIGSNTVLDDLQLWHLGGNGSR